MKKIKIISKIDKKKKSSTASVAGIGELSPRRTPDQPPTKKPKVIKVTISRVKKSNKVTEG